MISSFFFIWVSLFLLVSLWVVFSFALNSRINNYLFSYVRLKTYTYYTYIHINITHGSLVIFLLSFFSWSFTINHRSVYRSVSFCTLEVYYYIFRFYIQLLSLLFFNVITYFPFLARLPSSVFSFSLSIDVHTKTWKKNQLYHVLF